MADPMTSDPEVSTPWHNQSADMTLSQMGITPNGLSVLDAEKRLQASGPNEFKEGVRTSAEDPRRTS